MVNLRLALFMPRCAGRVLVTSSGVGTSLLSSRGPANAGECYFLAGTPNGRNAVVHVKLAVSRHFSLTAHQVPGVLVYNTSACWHFLLSCRDFKIFKIKGHTSLASYPLVALVLNFPYPNLPLNMSDLCAVLIAS